MYEKSTEMRRLPDYLKQVEKKIRNEYEGRNDSDDFSSKRNNA